MKSLVAGLVLILVIGIGGFIYRNVSERTGQPQQVACTLEAKICPDGSSVGREGPNCEFAACPTENKITLPAARISFTLPYGYEKGVQEPGADGQEEGFIDFYQRPAPADGFHYITIFDYPIPAGKTAKDVMVAHTTFQPSDMPATDMSKFKPVVINGNTFQTVVIERFEGHVQSSYFLARENDVLRFDIREKDVDWTNPDLVISDLPEHKSLVDLLSSLELQ